MEFNAEFDIFLLNQMIWESILYCKDRVNKGHSKRDECVVYQQSLVNMGNGTEESGITSAWKHSTYIRSRLFQIAQVFRVAYFLLNYLQYQYNNLVIQQILHYPDLANQESLGVKIDAFV